MDIKRLYRRWRRLGHPPTGMTARGVLKAAEVKGYNQALARDVARTRK